jgi:hypothetical protein
MENRRCSWLMTLTYVTPLLWMCALDAHLGFHKFLANRRNIFNIANEQSAGRSCFPSEQW